jgi:hypothetical protein
VQGLTRIWFIITAYLYQRGRGVENQPPDLVSIGPWLVTAGLVWIWALNLVRISMGFMLLRLKEERSGVWSLRSLILVQICFILAATTVQLLICRPLSGVWNPTPDMVCISASDMMTYGTVWNSKGKGSQE